MGFCGTNFNTIYSNKEIPNGYIFNPNTNLGRVTECIQTLVTHSKPGMIRTLLWPTTGNPNEETQWLHIPLLDSEISRIVAVLETTFSMCNAHYELAWGPIWESLPDTVGGLSPLDVKPNHPFATMDELAAATLEAFDRLSKALSKLQTSRIQIDFFNELDVQNQPKNFQLMSMIYPQLVKMMLDNKLSYTVSSIIEPNGNIKRARLTYIELEKIQKKFKLPKLPIVEVHANGFTDQMLNRYGKRFIQDMRKYTGCPVGVGECDCVMSFETELSIMYARPVYFCQW